ncbi:MAG: hypothetical protein KAX37_06160, partial [Opitutaceae bacterium]|nr:hypothetical protein [Opitutaceae bacterium]
LIVADVETGKVKRLLVLPGTEGSWGVTVASDGVVYVGAYRNGHVYRYEPGGDSITDLGPALAGQTFLYGLCAGSGGEIFGGSFPGAQVFRYSPRLGFEQIGEQPVLPGIGQKPTYVRTVAVDANRGLVYAGTGPGAQLARIDLESGRAIDVLPPEFRETDFLYGLMTTGSKVLVRLMAPGKGLVLDVSDSGHARVDATFPMTGLSFCADEFSAFYTADRFVFAYDFKSHAVRRVGTTSWPGNSYASTLHALSDQGRFPGRSVVGIANYNGRVWLARTSTVNGHTDALPLDAAQVAQTISSILAGPDGKIYASGYLTGGTATFDPEKPDIRSPTLRGVAQCEGMTHLNGRIYFGAYPGAIIYEYAPSKPWEEGVNPCTLFSLKEARQDRPYAMANDGGHRIVIGTVPEYGVVGGALTIYDTATGKHRTLSDRELGIPDLSIVSLVCHKGVAYGGTSISGGLGADPTQSEAKLLCYNLETGTSDVVEIPEEVGNKRVISAVIVGPDGRIWMMVEGWLLAFDPATRRFDEPKNLFPKVQYAPKASAVVVKDAALHLARDGWVYGVISNRILFRLDPKTRDLGVVSETEGGHDLVEDRAGTLYYVRDTSLVSYRP